jgi:hypothetical protein
MLSKKRFCFLAPTLHRGALPTAAQSKAAPSLSRRLQVVSAVTASLNRINKTTVCVAASRQFSKQQF